MKFNAELARKHVGERLAARREWAGKRQKEIAAAAGISPQFLSDLECGRGIPSPGTAEKLTEALGLAGDNSVGARVVSYYTALYGVEGRGDQAERVIGMADRYLGCVAEFGADAPSACGEWLEALEDAVEAFKRQVGG